MKVRVTLTKDEISDAINDYLVNTKGLDSAEIESIMSEDGRQVCETMHHRAISAHEELEALFPPLRCGGPIPPNTPDEYQQDSFVVFVIDVSASMNVEYIKDAVSSLVHRITRLHEGTYNSTIIKYVVFGTTAFIINQPYNIFNTSIANAGTDVSVGLESAINVILDNNDGSNLVDFYTYLITDENLFNEREIDKMKSQFDMIGDNSILTCIQLGEPPKHSEHKPLKDIVPSQAIVVESANPVNVDDIMDKITIDNPIVWKMV